MQKITFGKNNNPFNPYEMAFLGRKPVFRWKESKRCSDKYNQHRALVLHHTEENTENSRRLIPVHLNERAKLRVQATADDSRFARLQRMYPDAPPNLLDFVLHYQNM